MKNIFKVIHEQLCGKNQKYKEQHYGELGSLLLEEFCDLLSWGI